MAEMNEMMMRPWSGLSPYESFKISSTASKRPSGAAVAGLVLGSVGTAAAIGAWIIGPVIANSRTRGVEKQVELVNANTNNTLNRIANLLDVERAERVAQGLTISNTINDTVSGSQQGTLTAQQMSELSSFQNLQNTLLTDAVTGRSQLCPQAVTVYSAPAPCGCPGGCGN